MLLLRMGKCSDQNRITFLPLEVDSFFGEEEEEEEETRETLMLALDTYFAYGFSPRSCSKSVVAAPHFWLDKTLRVTVLSFLGTQTMAMAAT